MIQGIDFLEIFLRCSRQGGDVPVKDGPRGFLIGAQEEANAQRNREQHADNCRREMRNVPGRTERQKAPKAAEGRSVRESTVFRRESTVSRIDTNFSEMV